jgi:TPR repeat protein
MDRKRESGVCYLTRSASAVAVALCFGGVVDAQAQRVTNSATQYLPPEAVRNALRRSYVPPALALDDQKPPPRRIDPHPTADAEKRVELNALHEAGEAWREQGLAERAVPFYEKAGSRGHAPSLLRLGEMYSADDSGVVADPEKAAAYFTAAARTGDRTALHRLGVMHRDGIGGKSDAAKAASYFRQAMRPKSRGDVGSAVMSAAALLEAGQRLDREDLLGMLDLMQSSTAGSAYDRCTILLAAADLPRESAEKAPDSALPEAAKLREQAVMELQRAIDGRGAPVAADDLPRMQYRLAVLLKSLETEPQNSGARIAELLEAAASAGYLPARFRLERPSARDLSVLEVAQTSAESPPSAGDPPELEEAAPAETAPTTSSKSQIELIETAAEAGDADAQAEMGQLFLLGVGREKNPAQAFAWFRRSSRGDAAEGYYQLGLAYLKGVGTKVNVYNAAQAFGRAAEHGHPDAMYEYGRALRAGRGIVKDVEKSDEWLKKASAIGSGAAALALGRDALRSKSDGTRDVAGATRFFLQGARSGNRESQLELLKIVFASDGGPDAELGGATAQEVFAWSTALANDPSLSESQRKLTTYSLGRCYAGGIGTFKNLMRAADLFAGLSGMDIEESLQTKSVDVID